MRVLGIETSCDETAAAVVEDGHKVLSSVVASQVDLHARFGGVVPEIASRAHVELVNPVVAEALVEAGAALDDVDAVAACHGPGLAGALLVGVSAAKALAFTADRPYVGVNHLEAHLYASWLEEPDPVVLLHGGINGSSGTAGWRFMAPFLGANGFRVYCPDQPGFGWADTRQEYWPTQGLKSYVDFINDFADALCLDKFFLSGNSMGCIHTVHYVINHPERVLGYALIAGGIGDLVDPSKQVPGPQSKFSANPNYQRPPFDYNDAEESQRVLMAGIIYEAAAIWPELVTMRAKAAIRQHDSFETRVAATAELNKDPNYQQWASTKGRLDKLTIPAIYMYGMRDVLIPVENGFNQEDATPNIQYFYPVECGHQGQTDQPDMFNQAFLEFFRDGKVSWKTAEWANVSRRRPINPNFVEQPAGGFPQPDPNWAKQFENSPAKA